VLDGRRSGNDFYTRAELVPRPSFIQPVQEANHPSVGYRAGAPSFLLFNASS
jgi:hypothetical protein